MTVTKQAQALYHLQQIELSMLKTQKRLNEIADELANNDAVIAARAQREAAEQRLSPVRAKIRDLELEIQSTRQKASATEEQLYSGSVKSPKAMQEMQQEIEALKRRTSELEDHLLESMMTVEMLQSELEAAQAEEAQIIATWESEHQGLLDEQSTLKAEHDAFKAKRQEALKPIDEKSLEVYKTLRPRKGNQPVAVLNGDSCGLCGVQQTTAVVQAVQRGDALVECENCGRILVFK